MPAAEHCSGGRRRSHARIQRSGCWRRQGAERAQVILLQRVSASKGLSAGVGSGW